MMKQIPKFNSEAQEARWWDTQGGRIARDVEAAVGAGEDLTAQPAALLPRGDVLGRAHDRRGSFTNCQIKASYQKRYV